MAAEAHLWNAVFFWGVGGSQQNGIVNHTNVKDWPTAPEENLEVTTNLFNVEKDILDREGCYLTCLGAGEERER